MVKLLTVVISILATAVPLNDLLASYARLGSPVVACRAALMAKTKADRAAARSAAKMALSRFTALRTYRHHIKKLCRQTLLGKCCALATVTDCSSKFEKGQSEVSRWTLKSSQAADKYIASGLRKSLP